MNNKGFVFSLTAIYYVSIILLFLFMVYFSIDYYNTTESLDKISSKNYVNYLTGEEQLDIEDTSEYYWCTTYMAFDMEAIIMDDDIYEDDDDIPSAWHAYFRYFIYPNLNEAKYCEEYAK